MAQINFKNTDTPSTPNAGRTGLYFDASGNAYKIEDDGSSTPLSGITTLDDVSDVPAYPNDGSNYELIENNGSLSWELKSVGSGDVVGPGSSTDNAVARFDLATGKLIQNSAVTIDDSGNISGINNITGLDTNLVTGTAGTNGNLAQWNSDGDLVDGSIAIADILVEASIDTLSKINAIITDATLIDSSSLSTVATSGNYTDLSGLPSIPSTLSDLTDVVSATNTNRFALIANGSTGYVGRALVEADISDLQSYLTDAPSDGNEYIRLNGAWEIASSGSGGIPTIGSSTDNAIVRWDNTGGDTVQNSGIIIDDSDNLSGVNNRTGNDTNFVSGTAGISGNLVEWNADGDAVDSAIASADVLTEIPDEKDIDGDTDENLTVTGATNISLTDHVDQYLTLTGNATITFTDTPSSGETIVRSYLVESTAAETLGIANSTQEQGTYVADGSLNRMIVVASNYSTQGLFIVVTFEQFN